jgi:hypothetical protein
MADMIVAVSYGRYDRRGVIWLMPLYSRCRHRQSIWLRRVVVDHRTAHNDGDKLLIASSMVYTVIDRNTGGVYTAIGGDAVHTVTTSNNNRKAPSCSS